MVLVIYLNISKPLEPDRLFDCLPASLRPSTAQGENVKKYASDHNKNSENVVYSPPNLVPPKVILMLHKLAQQMCQTGQQQQVFIIYKEARSLCMESSLKKLGVEKLGKDDVQKMQ